MYKRIKGKKFSRKTDQRRAFMRSLAANLILQERIQTTKIRARQAATLVEKMITKAKKNDLASKKALAAFLPLSASQKLIATIGPRFKDRNGGYTRIIKLGPRAKDGAPMAIVELLDRPAAVVEMATGSKKAKKPAKSAAKKADKADKDKEKVNA